MKRNDLIAAIDIGSSKTTCAVARYSNNFDRLNILSVNYVMSRGIKSGIMTDMNLATNTIIEAIALCERDIGAKIENVVISISCGKIISQIIRSKIDLKTPNIREKDVDKVIKQALDNINQDKYEILHYIPTEFFVDDISGITNPIGMLGSSLTAKINIIAVPVTLINNLDYCFSKTQVNISDIVVGPYASGLGTLTDEEKQNGVILIEIGSMITSIALYDQSFIKYIDTIPIGSHHITNDIQVAFNLTSSQAERIKILHGNAFPENGNNMINVNSNDDEGSGYRYITQKQLSEVITPRIDEMTEYIMYKLEKVDNNYSMKNIVVTGGGASLYRLPEYLEDKISGSVRLGTPSPIAHTISGYELFHNNPSFASIAGLIHYAVKKEKIRRNNIIISSGVSIMSTIRKILFKKAV